MKIVRRGALPVGGESGLLDVRDRALKPVDASERGRGQRRAATTSGRPTSTGCSRSSTSSAIRPLKVVIDAANGMAGAMLPPVLERLPSRGRALLLRSRRLLPEPRAEPAAPGEPRVHRRARRSRRAPTSASRSTATPTAASSSTTRASSSPATSRPRCSPSRCSRRSPARRSSTTCARAGPCRRRSSAPAACRSSTASATRTSSTACARRTPRSAARSRATTTSATSRRPTPASSRSCSCSSCLEARREALGDPRRRSASEYFITGEINTPVADVALKLQELKERYAAEGDGLAPRRHLGRRRRLALQRAAVEHRAAAAAEPRGALASELMERSATRCSVADPLVTSKAPFSSPRARASASPTRMRRGSSTTGATTRTSTSRASSICARSACCATRAPATS